MRTGISTGILFLLIALTPVKAQDASTDRWFPLRFMIGTWNGTSKGQPGEGTAVRSYEFVLKDQFIQERNTSTYPPQDQNKSGEVHQHLGFFSFDKQRKTWVLRQFHQESFVINYVFKFAESTPQKLVFASESFENFDNSWRSRETYEIVSNDEFIETFELAPPGKPFELYSRAHFKRAK
jgi:hypothetical protein